MARIALGSSDRRLGGPCVRSFAQPDRAEFALAIADHYQGRGLGGILLGRLVEAAQSMGIGWLTAEVLATSPSPGAGLVPAA